MKIILGVYFVIQILIISSLMVLEIDLIEHIVMMCVACCAYLVVAFKKPGYYIKEVKSPSLSDQIHQHKQIQNDMIKQVCEEDQQDKNNQKLISDNTDKIQNRISLNNSKEISIKLRDQGGDKVGSQEGIIKQKSSLIKSQLQEANQKQFKKQISFLKDNSKIEELRYCRICKVFQPYRVRHCHECQRCICTFDHHCPWMSNCIGEKNRSLFWLYLVIQYVQFLLVFISVINKVGQQQNRAKAICFGLSVLFTATVSFSLLVFHSYLMVKNLTTWQLMRWEKISYLSKYKSKRQSPFSYGLWNNIKEFFRLTFGHHCKEWQINPEYAVKNKEGYSNEKTSAFDKVPSKKMNKQSSKIMQRPQTQRAIVS